MKLRSFVLAGSAAIALGAAAGFAFPVHAALSQQEQQERAETRQLNDQQAQNPGSAPDAPADTQAASGTSDTAAGRAAATVGNEVDEAVGPDAPVTKAELSKAVPLPRIKDPAKTLATAEIKNRKGEALGEVKSVDVNTDGTARDVKADVGGFLGVGEREVSLDAHNLVYVKNRNLIVTDMTRPQIENLPQVDKSY